MDLLINPAWAQAGSQADPITSFLPLIIIFVLFYFLLIRPQQKRQKEHKQMVEALEVGQEVVTGGGVLGKVTGVSELWITVEVANGVSLKVQRQTIAALMPKDTIKNA